MSRVTLRCARPYRRFITVVFHYQLFIFALQMRLLPSPATWALACVYAALADAIFCIARWRHSASCRRRLLLRPRRLYRSASFCSVYFLLDITRNAYARVALRLARHVVAAVTHLYVVKMLPHDAPRAMLDLSMPIACCSFHRQMSGD